MDEHEDDIDEQLELLPLDHRPIIPARAGHDGEQVYASIWQATMEQAPQIDYLGDEHRPIDDVLEDIVRPITQRDAAILATAACWLGCNFGQCLIDRAAREREESRWQAAHAYLHAWTLENLRRRGINGSSSTCSRYPSSGVRSATSWTPAYESCPSSPRETSR
jgi:hypothetical protein